MLEGLGGGPGARFGTLGRVLGVLGVVLGGLGMTFEGSVALLGANMAEKTNKTAKKLVSLNVPHALGRKKWRPGGPKGNQKGEKIDPKSDQKPSLKSASILSRF